MVVLSHIQVSSVEWLDYLQEVYSWIQFISCLIYTQTAQFRSQYNLCMPICCITHNPSWLPWSFEENYVWSISYTTASSLLGFLSSIYCAESSAEPSVLETVMTILHILEPVSWDLVSLMSCIFVSLLFSLRSDTGPFFEVSQLFRVRVSSAIPM